MIFNKGSTSEHKQAQASPPPSSSTAERGGKFVSKLLTNFTEAKYNKIKDGTKYPKIVLSTFLQN